MKSLFVVLFSLLSISISAQEYVPDKRMRVIIDNDFGGDPDGLFQLAHHLLSPSVEICGIIGSPLTPEAGFDNGGNSAEKACQKARELMALQTGWEADAASSDYIVRKAPRIADDGTYLPNEQGRDIRIYTRLDTRLMFEDMIAKFKQYER